MSTMRRYFKPVSQERKKNMQEAVMPVRATKTSAGYDLFAPCDIEIKPQEKAMIWTDIKAYMPQGEMIILDVTSSMGGELDLMLANTIGVIDADYVDNAKNEGNIGVCLRNLKPQVKLLGHNKVIVDGVVVEVPIIRDLTEPNTITIKRGQKIGQAIFVEYKQADNCNSDNERTGGWGSTNK